MPRQKPNANPTGHLWNVIWDELAPYMASQDEAQKMTSLIALQIVNNFTVKARLLNTPDANKVEAILKDLRSGMGRASVQAKYGITKGQLSGLIFRNKALLK